MFRYLKSMHFARNLPKLVNNAPKHQMKFNNIDANFTTKNLASSTPSNLFNLDDKVSTVNDNININTSKNTAHGKLNLWNDKNTNDAQLINKAYNLLAKMEQVSFSQVSNDVNSVSELQNTLKQFKETLLSPDKVLGVPLISNKDTINSLDDVFMNVNTEPNNSDNPKLSQQLLVNLRNDLNVIGTNILKQYEELVRTQVTHETHESLIQLVHESYASGYNGKVDLANKYDMQPLMFTRRGNSWYGLKSIFHSFKDHYYVKNKVHHGVQFKVFTGEPLYGLKVDAYIMKDSGNLVLSVAGTSGNINDLVDDVSIAFNSGVLLKSKPIHQFLDSLVSEWKSATDGLNIDQPQSFIVGHSLGSRVGAYMMAYLEKKYNFNVRLNTFEDPGGHSHMLEEQFKLSPADPYIKKYYKEKITVVNSKVDNPINELHSLAGINQFQYWNGSNNQSLIDHLYRNKWLITKEVGRPLKPFISELDFSYSVDMIFTVLRKLLDKVNINSHTVKGLSNDIATGFLLINTGVDEFSVPSKSLFDYMKQKYIELNNKKKLWYLHNEPYQQYHSKDAITLIYEDNSLSINREDFLQLVRDNCTQIVENLRLSYSALVELLCNLEKKIQDSMQDIILDNNIETDNNAIVSAELEYTDLLGSVSDPAAEAG